MALTRVEVTSPAPRSWVPLKPALSRFVRWYRERDAEPPVFSGVPICLFGSEWSSLNSAAPQAPARGRCTVCQVRKSCGFGAEVPDELLPISDSTLPQRWRDYSAAFLGVTGSDAAIKYSAFVEKIVSVYRVPVSLDPSVLLGTHALSVPRSFLPGCFLARRVSLRSRCSHAPTR
jgi:hypothetical protein